MDEHINKLEICMQGIKTDVEYIKEALHDNKKEHKEILSRIEKWIDASEKRFAPMWAATVIKWVMMTAGLAMLAAVYELILK